MSNKSTILIIDDEPDIRGLLSMTIERMGHNTVCAANIKDAKAQLSNQTFSLCLTDLKLPDGSGIDIVGQIQSQTPNTPVIVITAHGSIDIAIEAMKCGAFDFINKPVDLTHLRNLISNALNSQQQTIHIDGTKDIAGNSPLTKNLREQILKVARSQAPVFIQGESGSGKELVARAIHKSSNRHNKPFIAVNCGAIPRELMESEFFGHTKGSFTGAHQDKLGLFQSAEGGTLFLDEVADLPMEMQVKLLRALQEKMIRPVGAQKEIAIDIRILSATHKNLMAAINEGLFRNDLYYRINVIEINVPALRQRVEDIKLLTTTLLSKISKKNKTADTSISKEAISALQNYAFPGNVRELENILERASALCNEDNIELSDLQFQGGQTSITEYKVSEQQAHTGNGKPVKNGNKFNPNEISLDEYLDNIEKDIILDHLEQNRWNRTTTAKVLGITFRSLRYRLKKLGIDDD